MILNTNCDCKLLSIKVVKAKAFVTLLFHSNAPATTHRVFRFYIKDGNGGPVPLMNTNYWIDRANTYFSDSSNVDINLHKEVVVEIDISKANRGTIVANRWTRSCSLVLMDMTTTTRLAWSSERLDLVSKEIALPQIINFESYASAAYAALNISFDFHYALEDDFAFSKDTLRTGVVVRSDETDAAIDSRILSSSDLVGNTHSLAFTAHAPYDGPLIIEVNLQTLYGQILWAKTYQYFPTLKARELYTLVNGEVRKIGTVYKKGLIYAPNQEIDVKVSDVLPPTITDDPVYACLFHITRNDTEENLPYHYVDVYINDMYYTTTQSDQISLAFYVKNSYAAGTLTTIKFISRRTRDEYTRTCPTPVSFTSAFNITNEDLFVAEDLLL